MKKYNINIKNNICETYYDVYFIDCFESYFNYLKIVKNSFLLTENHLKEENLGVGHNITNVADSIKSLVNLFSNAEFVLKENIKEHQLQYLFNIKSNVIEQQIQHINNNKILIINNNGGYFLIDESYEYDLELIYDDVYCEEDIKISKCFKGNHYYGKIRDVDVVDDFGNVKWNSYEEAMNIAKRYLTILNK